MLGGFIVGVTRQAWGQNRLPTDPTMPWSLYMKAVTHQIITVCKSQQWCVNILCTKDLNDTFIFIKLFFVPCFALYSINKTNGPISTPPSTPPHSCAEAWFNIVPFYVLTMYVLLSLSNMYQELGLCSAVWSILCAIRIFLNIFHC